MTEKFRFKDFLGNIWYYYPDYNVLTEEECYNCILPLNVNRNKLKPFFYSITEDLIYQNNSVVALEITRECNFNCRYCYIPKKNIKISETTMNDVIDFIIYKVAKKKEDVIIGFGTGEPFLQYKSIVYLVENLKKRFHNESQNKNIHFTVTTNASLITEDILKFLDIHKFSIAISIDGPPDITNFNRNKNAYENAIKVIKLINEKFKNIVLTLSIVIYNANIHTISKINSWLQELHLHNKNLIVSFGSVNDLVNNYELICYNLFDSILNNNFQEKIIEIELIRRRLKKIHDSFNMFIDMDIPLLGICFPGERLLVGYDGNLYLCEKSLHSFQIGNVQNGINLNKVKYLINQFVASIHKLDCNKCWARHFCMRCYLSLNKDLYEYCKIEQYEILYVLKLYCSILKICENNLEKFFTLINYLC